MATLPEPDELWSEYAKKKDFFIAKLYGNFSGAIKACRYMALKLQKSGPINQIAWYACNLLELQIWVEFCCGSKANATEFYEDAIVDLAELMTLPEQSKALISTQNKPHKFKRVRDAATSLGAKDETKTWRDYYDEENKLLSKFVHPTALSVVTLIAPIQARSIQSMFVAAAEEFAHEGLKTLDCSFIADLDKYYARIAASIDRDMRRKGHHINLPGHFLKK
jgi:hypothetical protein